MYGRRLAILLIGLATLGAQAVGAQGQWVQRYVGRLQWISASSVMVIAPPNGPSIAIDLTRVPQGQYSSLEAGEWVVVTGEHTRNTIASSATLSSVWVRHGGACSRRRFSPWTAGLTDPLVDGHRFARVRPFGMARGAGRSSAPPVVVEDLHTVRGGRGPPACWTRISDPVDHLTRRFRHHERPTEAEDYPCPLLFRSRLLVSPRWKPPTGSSGSENAKSTRPSAGRSPTHRVACAREQGTARSAAAGHRREP